MTKTSAHTDLIIFIAGRQTHVSDRDNPYFEREKEEVMRLVIAAFARRERVGFRLIQLWMIGAVLTPSPEASRGVTISEQAAIGTLASANATGWYTCRDQRRVQKYNDATPVIIAVHDVVDAAAILERYHCVNSDQVPTSFAGGLASFRKQKQLQE